jgi:hypothetical protein
VRKATGLLEVDAHHLAAQLLEQLHHDRTAGACAPNDAPPSH